MNNEPIFVSELPSSGRPHRSGMWDAVAAHPGEWAEWWTDNPKSAYSGAAARSRDGRKFEATIRNGKAFVRLVPS